MKDWENGFFRESGSAVKFLRHLPTWLVKLATYIGAGTTLVASGVYLWNQWDEIRDRDVPMWVLIPFALATSALVVGAFLLGRRSYRRLPPNAAERARVEVQVARTYLRHTIDFMEGLRLTIVHGTPADTTERLDALRDLVFDAIIQGINTGPGDTSVVRFLSRSRSRGPRCSECAAIAAIRTVSTV